MTGKPARIASLDIVRGAVMVLMALDHVRVYSGVPAGGPTYGIFLTRWVTHFCAPVFVFLAGTAAFLYGQSLGDRKALARYLVTRGALLVVLELTVIHVSWTFTLGASLMLAGVIWMIGWCMILLAALLWLPVPAIAAAGVAIVAGQGAVGALGGLLPDALRSAAWSWMWDILSYGIRTTETDGALSVLYTIVPWIGVMACGYAFGAIMTADAVARRRRCLQIGLAATAAFVLVATAGALTPAADDAPPLLIRILNQRKYPASLLFLLMTLGPAIAVLPLLEQARGWAARALATFGRVPMFYYLLHIPFIHAVALGVWLVRDGDAHTGYFTDAPYVSMPPAEWWSLPLLYLVFAAVVVVLYVPCRWYADFKARSGARWTRYL